MARATLSGVGRQLERLFTSGTATGLSEGQLLERFVTRQDEAAFEALVARHGPMVLGVCRRMLRDPNDVDDAFQATFLVLVRKAGSLRRRDLLGNWLYGVAFKVAARARATASRRHATEIPDVEELEQMREHDDPEPALHEEVRRLPEKYRIPVVLCYLEGLTHDEAAARLSWPIGTVKGRLVRARELLRSRLMRRGVSVASAAALPVLLSRDAGAAVPPVLLNQTLKVSSLVAAGKSAGAGLISAHAVALSEGVIEAMYVTKLKLVVATLVVACSVMTGAGVLAYQGSGAHRGPGTVGPNDPTSPTTANRLIAAGGSFQPVGAGPDEQDAGLPPEVRPLDREVQIHDLTFSTMLRDVRNWDERKIDRLFHWSRAAKEAEEYLTEVNPELAKSQDRRLAPLKAHRDRMKKLHELTQGLKGPNQAQIADTARASYEQAERDLAAATAAPNQPGAHGPGGMMGGGMAGRGMMGMRGPAVGESSGGTGGGTGIGPVGRGAMMPGGAGAAGGGGFAGEGGFGGADDREAAGYESKLRIAIAEIAPKLAAADKSPKTRAIVEKLEEPITMSFPDETPLQDVLNYIKSASAGPKDKGIPIYVDPIGLAEAEKTTTSVVQLDLEDVPLKTTLRLVLKQLGLSYCVKDGLLFISSPGGVFQELKESMRNFPSEVIDVIDFSGLPNLH